MKELKLKYGSNPNQKSSRLFTGSGELPLEILSGKPGYINFLDALNGYQLVSELKAATKLPAATSFKHVSPAGAAVGTQLNDVESKIYFTENKVLSPIACAYARARGSDRVCSYGDWVALSDACDEETAELLLPEVSDGIIAPDYNPKALEMLKAKRKGNYNIVKIDPDYSPSNIEQRSVFGITFEQGRNELKIDGNMLSNIVTSNKELPSSAKLDLIVALITLKYTQSNSVCYVKNGQTIGVGAGQQSRIHCTKLAGSKADNWFMRQHEKVLGLPFRNGLGLPIKDNAIDVYISDFADDILQDGAWQDIFEEKPDPLSSKERKDWIVNLTDVSLGSDAFFPFEDNIKRAIRSGVKYIAQPGGSIRDDEVIRACDRNNVVMAFTGIRLFHH